MDNQFNYNDIGSCEVRFGDDRKTMARAVVRKTYIYMFIALAISGLFAYVTYITGQTEEMIADGRFIGLMIAELVIVIVANILLSRNNYFISIILLGLYSIINGMTLSIIFVYYQLGSITTIFFITAGLFAGMAFYGHVTKRDLTSVGNLALMALIGVIMVTFVNMFFLKSDGLDLGLAYLGVLIFVGLTAYDAQKVKNLAETSMDLTPDSIALWGALNLYLDFINLLWYLIRIFGKRN